MTDTNFQTFFIFGANPNPINSETALSSPIAITKAIKIAMGVLERVKSNSEGFRSPMRTHWTLLKV